MTFACSLNYTCLLIANHLCGKWPGLLISFFLFIGVHTHILYLCNFTAYPVYDPIFLSLIYSISITLTVDSFTLTVDSFTFKRTLICVTKSPGKSSTAGDVTIRWITLELL